MKTFQIKRWSPLTARWEAAGTKDTLGEAIASIRYQHEQYVTDDPNVEFEVIEVNESLVFEFPCDHYELDHGICVSCTEDRDSNSHRFGKTIHEPSVCAPSPTHEGSKP